MSVQVVVRPGARAPRRPETGAAAVEFALVVPVLILLVIGMITTGLAYSDHLAATNAVREGARYGAAADIASPSWASSVRQRVRQVYFNAGVAVEDDQICVRLVTSGGSTHTQVMGSTCGTAPTVPTGMTAGSCAVLVWMQRPATIRLAVAPDIDFDINAASVAYYGREVQPTCTAS